MADSLIERQTSFNANLILFCRYLRERGFTIGVKEESQIVSVLNYELIQSRHNLMTALRILICKNPHQFQQFEMHYQDFWKELERAVDSKISQEASEKRRNKPVSSPPTIESLKSWLYHHDPTEQVEIARYSPLESFSRKEFAKMNAEELRLIEAALKQIARRLSFRKSRLFKHSKNSHRINMKATLRKSMRSGGEISEISFFEKKKKRLKVVVLADVSKSMELYSLFFIHLIYALHNAYDKISTWVFSTTIVNISDFLQSYAFDKAFEMASERMPNWSGGTRIGHCLTVFNEIRSNWLVDRNTVVFVLSDGWDTGEPELLERSMSSLYSRSRKLIWLNPLAGSPEFSPEVSGLKTAMPYVDHHLPCHNLESMKAALRHLTTRRSIRNVVEMTKE